MSSTFSNFKISKKKNVLSVEDLNASGFSEGTLFIVDDNGNLLGVPKGVENQVLTVKNTGTGGISWENAPGSSLGNLEIINNTINTTVATPEILTEINTDASGFTSFTYFLIDMKVVGKRSDGSAGVGYIIKDLFKKVSVGNISDTFRLLGLGETREVFEDELTSELSLNSFSPTIGVDATIDVSGGKIQAKVQGETGVSWDWVSQISYIVI